MRLLVAKELISTSVKNVEHGNQWNNQCLIMNSLFVSDRWKLLHMYSYCKPPDQKHGDWYIQPELFAWENPRIAHKSSRKGLKNLNLACFLQYRSRILRRRISYIRFFCAHGRKNARFMCLCYSVLEVSFIFHCCMKQRTSGLKKRRVDGGKFTLWKELHVTFMHVASLRAFLDNEQ